MIHDRHPKSYSFNLQVDPTVIHREMFIGTVQYILTSGSHSTANAYGCCIAVATVEWKNRTVHWWIRGSALQWVTKVNIKSILYTRVLFSIGRQLNPRKLKLRKENWSWVTCTDAFRPESFSINGLLFHGRVPQLPLSSNSSYQNWLVFAVFLKNYYYFSASHHWFPWQYPNSPE